MLRLNSVLPKPRRVLIDILAFYPESFQAQSQDKLTIEHTISTEGVTLYAKGS